MIVRGAATVVAALLLTACSSASGGVPMGTAGSDSTAAPSASSTQPTPAQWCASYASLTQVLATTGSDQASAETALAALERFDLLWGIADNMGIVSSDEVAANQRLVAAYRAVMTLVVGGATVDSPEVKLARTELEAAADKDRTDLKASAGRVLARCGTASASPSA